MEHPLNRRYVAEAAGVRADERLGPRTQEEQMRARLSTIIRGRRDLSAYPDDTSMAEPALLQGYGILNPHETRRPCQCGGTVTADLECPADGVRAHQGEPIHGLWRLANGL